MRWFKLAGVAVAVCAVVSSPRLARGEPLQPQHVPHQAKWVIHVDFDAFDKTALADRIRKNRPHLVEFARKWMGNNYGIDLPEELHGLTMFNDSYASHTGTAILFAEYDRDKVRADIEKRSNVSKQNWNDHVLYVCTEAKDSTAPDATAQKPPQHGTVVLLDKGRLVMASSPELAKAAVGLLGGQASAPDTRGTELTANIPAGSVIYGAAIDLAQIQQNDYAFPILRQHEKVVYATGEDNGEVFENTSLLAKSEDVAKRMEQAFVGFVALYRVWADQEEAMLKIADKVEIRRDGKTLTSRFRADTNLTFAALEQMLDRFQGQKAETTAKRDKAEAR